MENKEQKERKRNEDIYIFFLYFFYLFIYLFNLFIRYTSYPATVWLVGSNSRKEQMRGKSTEKMDCTKDETFHPIPGN